MLSYKCILAFLGLKVLSFQGIATLHSPPSFLYVLLWGGAHPERNIIARKNIELLGNASSHKYRVDCLILSYAPYSHEPDWFKLRSNGTLEDCFTTTITKTTYIHLLKALQPWLIASAGYDYISLVCDDVISYPPESSFQLEKFYDIVVNHNLVAATPSIVGSSHVSLRPPSQSLEGYTGRLISSVEVQAVTFRIDAWKCMYDLIDTEYPSGYGIDVWFYEYCTSSGRVPNGRLGVIDSQFVIHKRLRSVNKNKRSKVHYMDQIKQWKIKRNLSLVVNVPRTLGYF